MGVQQQSGRHYGMDWLRIGAFLLLIFYHVGLAFGPWDYEWKSDATSDWVALPLLAMNAWRLSLLFAISGYASAALLARRVEVGGFAKDRLARLGIPLLFGMLVIMPPQPWVQQVTQFGYGQGFWHFLAHDYFTFEPLPGGTIVPTWMQLWFVVYLLFYTLLACAFLSLVPAKIRATLRSTLERLLSGWLLLPVGVVYVYVARQLPGGWNDAHDLVSDRAAHAAYLSAFLFGWLLRGSSPLVAAIARQWRLAALLATLATAYVVGIEWRYPGDTPAPEAAIVGFRWARAAQCWATIIALFGIAERYWNRDHRWRLTLAEAVLPFYIIHQTVILVAGYAIGGLGWSMIAQWSFVMTATIAGCWLFYWVGQQIGWLRPLIGLRRVARRADPPVVHGAAA